MFQLTFEVDGDVQLSRAFSRFAEDVKDAREPFEEVAEDFRNIMSKQFGTEGTYGSGGWAPLSPNYAEWKARNYPGARILERTGLLRDSLEGANPYTIREIRPLEMTVGTKVPYGIFHQRGTKKMPQRKIINLTEADKTRWTKIFHKWLVEQSRKEFAGLMPTIGISKKHISTI